MIRLDNYREYWERIAADIPCITGTMPVTMDDGMSKRILNLKTGDVVLFYLPPSGESNSVCDYDSWSEQNICVVFVMEKYDPQRRTAFQTLESTQPIIEAIKQRLIESSCVCGAFRVDVSSVNTLPETSFYAGFAGWSIGFKLID